MSMKKRLLILCLLVIQLPVYASSFDTISNFITYSENFASSGQPTEADLIDLAKAGYQKIIYIALTTDNTALAGEDEIVLKNGMQYLHVAVDFSKPKLEAFQTVTNALNATPNVKTLLHCQINLRASTFSFLYRVIFLHIPMEDAKADLDSIWIPNPIWFKFIKDTLAHYGKTHACDKCDWGELDFEAD